MADEGIQRLLLRMLKRELPSHLLIDIARLLGQVGRFEDWRGADSAPERHDAMLADLYASVLAAWDQYAAEKNSDNELSVAKALWEATAALRSAMAPRSDRVGA